MSALSGIRLIVLAIVVFLLVATWPQLLGLHRFPFLAQLTALRGLLILASTGGLLLLGLVAWRSRSWRRFSLAMAGILAFVSSLNLALMFSRGLSAHEVFSGQAADLTVMVWNMYRDGPDPGIVADFAIEHRADVLSLLETSPAAAHEISRRMSEAGLPMQVFTNTFDEISRSRSTVLLVSSAIGEYVADESAGSPPRVPSVVARPLDHGGPTLVAAHAAPPLPTMMRDWANGLRWLAERCDETNVIVAGDFNATLDHFAGLREPHADVGACRDGAKALGSASLGTWPSWVPTFLGSPIDHVVATGEWEFVEFRVALELDGLGSDHRALVARLRRVEWVLIDPSQTP